MKRLFEFDGVFFDNKEAAKVIRNARGCGVIRKGPDHWRYGVKGNPRTHSHNARSGGHGTGFPKKVK